MVWGWFKHIAFFVHFTSILLRQHHLGSSGIGFGRLGTPDLTRTHTHTHTHTVKSIHTLEDRRIQSVPVCVFEETCIAHTEELLHAWKTWRYVAYYTHYFSNEMLPLNDSCCSHTLLRAPHTGSWGCLKQRLGPHSGCPALILGNPSFKWTNGGASERHGCSLSSLWRERLLKRWLWRWAEVSCYQICL